MTADELRKLAEIAGVGPIDEIDVLGRTALFTWVPNPFKSYTRCEWQPHLRIEQAMMVAENAFGWFAAKRERPNGEWEYTFQGAHKTEHGVIDFMGVGASLSEAICRTALAAKEG